MTKHHKVYVVAWLWPNMQSKLVPLSAIHHTEEDARRHLLWLQLHPDASQEQLRTIILKFKGDNP